MSAIGAQRTFEWRIQEGFDHASRPAGPEQQFAKKIQLL
jgi:hypothetical protein